MSRVRQILDMNAFDAATGGDGAVKRRLDNLGAASVLFYREPIEMVAARGAWMEARDGTRYLDFYNNVPSVGHSHPEVVASSKRSPSPTACSVFSAPIRVEPVAIPIGTRPYCARA